MGLQQHYIQLQYPRDLQEHVLQASCTHSRNSVRPHRARDCRAAFSMGWGCWPSFPDLDINEHCGVARPEVTLPSLRLHER